MLDDFEVTGGRKVQVAYCLSHVWAARRRPHPKGDPLNTRISLRGEAEVSSQY